MSICSNNQNIVDGISPHNLVCQSDNSIKLIRFIGNKLGIVKGINELASIDLSSFYIPIENYNIQTISLCPDEIKKIDVSGISINGKRRKTFEFEFNNNIKKLDINIKRDGNNIETINIEDMDNNSAISHIITHIINNSKIIRASKKENTNDIILTCISSGDDIDIDISSETDENVNVDVDLKIIQEAFRYPEFDVVKYLLLFVDFDKLTNKNKQTIEYKFNDDIDKWYKSSRILMLSGTDNLKDEDDNLIKTISVKNTSPCRITLNILTAL